jgi:hypothetical protein
MNFTQLLPNYVAQQIVVEPSGCWRWAGAVSGSGYGHVQTARRLVGAHRFVYARLVGPIADKHDLHHRCGLRTCVNPLHLEPLSRRAHMERDQRTDALVCRSGLHDLTEPDAYIVRRTGKRQCRACVQAAERERYRRSRPCPR